MRHILAALFLATPMLVMSIPNSSVAQDSSIAGADKKAVEKLVRDYILSHPEIVVEALTVFQKREEQDAKQRQSQALVHLREALERAEGDPVLGNPDGDVTLVEFFDYQCGYCKSMTSRIEKLLDTDKNVRLVLKEFPILGPASVTAARASLAAERQDLYKPFHLALMAMRGRLTDAAIFQTAREVGLNIEKLRQDMKHPAIGAMIERNKQIANALEVRGTPAFVAGNELMPGAVSTDRLMAAIATARKNMN